MLVGSIYLFLLMLGIVFFALHYLAMGRLARRLRTKHAPQWAIIANDEKGQPVSAMRRWLRLQNAARSPALPALHDNVVTRWRQVWRIAPWLAWLSLLAAFALRWSVR